MNKKKKLKEHVIKALAQNKLPIEIKEDKANPDKCVLILKDVSPEDLEKLVFRLNMNWHD